MTIRYLDPTAQPGVPVEPYTLQLAEGPATVALLANNFPGSVQLLDAFERELKSRSLDVRRYEKPRGVGTSVVLPSEQLDEIVSGSDALVTAYGH